MSADSSRATPLHTRLSFHCFNCNYSAVITTTAHIHSLACPSCHQQRSIVHRLTFSYPPTNTSDQLENGFSGESHVEDFDDWFASARKKSASKSFLKSLPSIRITEADLKESSSCSICMDDFVFGASADKLPCKHVFHKSCIVEWLSRNNTCPLCRFKLPVEPRTPVTALPRRRAENNLDVSVGGNWTLGVIRRVTVTRTGRGGFSGSNTTGRVGMGGIFNFDRGSSGSNTILDVVMDDDGDTLMIEDVQRDADGDVLMADA